MSESVLVIGGGPAGLQASADLAELGYQVTLVEKESFLGGTPVKNKYTKLMPDFRDAKEVMDDLVDRVKRNKSIEVRFESTLESVSPSGSGYEAKVQNGSKKDTVKADAVILTTGFAHFDARRDGKYGYGLFPDVVTGSDLEAMMQTGKLTRPSDGAPVKRVGFVLCVGSRDRHVGNNYCSRVCCAVSTKQAIEVKHMVPDAEVFVFYMDIRTYGFWEDALYWKAQEEDGVIYVKGRIAEITQRQGGVMVKGEDTLVSGPFEAPFDLVVLAAGMEPGEGTQAVAKAFGIPLNVHGFIQPRDGITAMVETDKAGVFVAGAATGPKAIEDAITEGSAAALKAAQYLRKKA